MKIDDKNRRYLNNFREIINANLEIGTEEKSEINARSKSSLEIASNMCQTRSQPDFVSGHWRGCVRWVWHPNANYMGVAPNCVQSCKNIDHDSGALASFRSQC